MSEWAWGHFKCCKNIRLKYFSQPLFSLKVFVSAIFHQKVYNIKFYQLLIVPKRLEMPFLFLHLMNTNISLMLLLKLQESLHIHLGMFERSPWCQGHQQQMESGPKELQQNSVCDAWGQPLQRPESWKCPWGSVGVLVWADHFHTKLSDPTKQAGFSPLAHG